MFAKIHRRAALLLAAVLVLVSTGAELHAQDAAEEARPAPRTDVVYLLDVSGSMRKERALDRARELLAGIADKLVQPGTKVALIPFGTGVHDARRFDVPADREGATKALAEIRDAFGDVRARDSYTYLYQAIQKGLETLAEFKRANPGHARHIILVSDGKQLMRRGDRGPSLREIVEYVEGLGFKRGEDWFIWYGHFGAPDEALKSALEELGAGKSIPLDELPTLHWAFTSIETETLDLGRQKIGAWTQKAKLVARTDGNGVGKTLTLRVAPGSLPEGVTLDVTPKTVKLAGERHEFEITITCKGAPGGRVVGAVLEVDTPSNSLHWVENGRVEVSFFAGQPRIDVGTATLQIGRLAPGMRATRNVALIPNEDAASLAPRVKMSVGSAPHAKIGVRDDVDASARVEVPVEIVIPADAKPGTYTTTITVDAGKTVEVVPASIRVSYVVGTGRVTVGEDALALGRVLAGREATATITLTPDDETARLGTEIQAQVHVFAARGVVMTVPATIRLKGRTSVPVKVAVPSDAVGGAYEARVRFVAPEGVEIVPGDGVPVTFRVVEASALSLPPVVDLGDVAAAAAREVSGRLELVVGGPHDGLELELVARDEGATIEPRVVTLKQGKMAIPVTVRTPDASAGEHGARFDAFVTRDGERTKVRTVKFRWLVRESFVKVASWANPASVGNGDGEAAGTLVVRASEDLAGKKLRIAAAFGGLASGMEVALGTQEVELTGGQQTVPVTLGLKGARTGTYEGTLDLAAGAFVETVKVKLEVVGATVLLTYEGGFDGLEAGAARVVTLVLTASGVRAPAEFAVGLDRAGLPVGLKVEVPERVTVTQGDGVTRVPVRLVTGGELPEGSWQPTITVKALTAGVAVTPESVTIRASVPEAVTVVKVEKETVEKSGLWIWLGGALVALFAIALFVLSRRKQIVHVHAAAAAAPQEPAPALEDDDLILEEDDMFVIED